MHCVIVLFFPSIFLLKWVASRLFSCFSSSKSINSNPTVAIIAGVEDHEALCFAKKDDRVPQTWTLLATSSYVADIRRKFRFTWGRTGRCYRGRLREGRVAVLLAGCQADRQTVGWLRKRMPVCLLKQIHPFDYLGFLYSYCSRVTELVNKQPKIAVLFARTSCDSYQGSFGDTVCLLGGHTVLERHDHYPQPTSAMMALSFVHQVLKKKKVA